MRNTIVVDIARFAAGDDYNPETIRSWILAYRRFNEAVSMLGETEKTYFLEYLRNKSVPDERFGFRLKYQILLINITSFQIIFVWEICNQVRFNLICLSISDFALTSVISSPADSSTESHKIGDLGSYFA